MYTIYKVTNKINGKAYIGFDSKWPSRKSVHICEAITRKNKKYPLYRALQKYGLENFEWEVLYQGEDREYTLNIMENKLIIEHNTHFKEGHGYNMTFGGEGTFGWMPTEETKKKISDSKKGKSSWNKGKPSPWTTERNRKLKGTKQPKLMKTYEIIDPNGNIHTITGLSDFCKKQKLHAGNMSSVAHGRLKQYKGWLCKMINKNNIAKGA